MPRSRTGSSGSDRRVKVKVEAMDDEQHDDDVMNDGVIDDVGQISSLFADDLKSVLVQDSEAAGIVAPPTVQRGDKVPVPFRNRWTPPGGEEMRILKNSEGDWEDHEVTEVSRENVCDVGIPAKTVVVNNGGTNDSKLSKNFYPFEGFDTIYGSSGVPPFAGLGTEVKSETEEKKEDDRRPKKKRPVRVKEENSKSSSKKSSSNDVDMDTMSMSMDSGNNDSPTTSTPIDAPIKSLKDKWRLLPHFLHLRGLMKQHISSYDHFINHRMKEIVTSPSSCKILSDNDPKFFLKFTDCWVGEPDVEEGKYKETHQSTPFRCRMRDLTYSAPIHATIVYMKAGKATKASKVIGRMPIMLRSSKCVLNGASNARMAELQECPHDPGGYFVVKGVEKTLLMQEQLSKNRVIIAEDTKKYLSANITSSTNERKSNANILLKNGRLYVRNNTLGDDVNVVIVLKAMGMVADSEIVQLVGNESDVQDALALTLQESSKLNIRSQLDALRYVGHKIRNPEKVTQAVSRGGVIRTMYQRPAKSPEDEAREVLANVLLSHVPITNFDFRPKCIYICYIIRRILLVKAGKQEVDDKDYYGNKRLELAGQLLALLFEDLFKNMTKSLKKEIEMVLSKPAAAQAFDAKHKIRPDIITNGLVTTISTGNWNIRRFRMERPGVTQPLSRLSYIAALGMMTRVSSQFEKTRKVSGPRSLQPSQWGMLCPCDTPEGEACGLVKNLALLAHITTDCDTTDVTRLCYDCGVVDVSLLSGSEILRDSSFFVLINGLVLGITNNPKRLVNQLRTMRRKNFIGEFVSVYLNETQKSVHIASDEGRVCRPLLIVDPKTNRPKLSQSDIEAVAMGTKTIKDLLKTGVAEYLDVNEENNCSIAVTEKELIAGKKCTHLEIDPLTLLGVVAGLIPYPHHNQSPRNTYQSAMGKQAMGTVALNQYERIDGLLYTIVYPQKPMVKTRTLDLINFDELPGGQNACLAVMSYSGYDIEDAIVLNKASLDRGFGRCMVLKKQQVTKKKYAIATEDRIYPPPHITPDGDLIEAMFTPEELEVFLADGKTLPKKLARFAQLDNDGLVHVGSRVKSGDVLANKHVPSITQQETDANGQLMAPHVLMQQCVWTPANLVYKTPTPSMVDNVMITRNDNDSYLVKIALRQTRRPEVGDKFSSRHGQKGVCGIIVNQEDMPFDDNGICPDLIMNPHGFPSRMTVGKLLELVVGKAGVFEGRQGYASAFGESEGNADTVEAAAQALIANGLSYTGKDTFYSGTSGEPLDAYIFAGPVFYQKLKHMVVDKIHARAKGPRAVLTRQPTEGRSRDGGLRLGEMERDCLIAYGTSNLIMERLMKASDAFTANVCTKCGLLQYHNWCQFCRSGDKVVDISMPYACKLLFQELQSMNVLPKLKLKDL